MKSDFLLAITQLSAEKNLPKETVIGAVETALVSAYKKDNFSPTQNIAVRINPATGKVTVWAEKIVTEKPLDPRSEISLSEANQIKPDAQVDDTVVVEATPYNAGRIAAQTAKQVILQRLHEAEYDAILEEYTDKEGDIIAGTVRRLEPKQILIDLGRAEAVLPFGEQVPSERYRVGQRLKVYLLEIARTSKGPKVLVSRSHPNLLRRLFELEVPEVYNGIVEIKAVAREAGHRSKIAVAARQAGIDAIGCCVGLRGIRIQSIVNELNGERIDVVQWDPSPSVFISNALSPANVGGVELKDTEISAFAIVPDKQLSLAIGREGQNVRLAAKLTGWKIDIKSASEAEIEKAETEKDAGESVEADEAPAEIPTEIEEEIREAMVAEGGLAEATPSAEEPAMASAETIKKPPATLDTELIPPQASLESTVTPEKMKVRFAEEIISPAKQVPKSRKKKKKGTREESESFKQKRRQEKVFTEEDEEY
jgi:N utilization substance protein A